jgi:hypothetical protein
LGASPGTSRYPAFLILERLVSLRNGIGIVEAGDRGEGFAEFGPISFNTFHSTGFIQLTSFKSHACSPKARVESKKYEALPTWVVHRKLGKREEVVSTAAAIFPLPHIINYD